jgi:hypothetical protein
VASRLAFSAAPAIAGAASTCTYNPDTKSVIVDDFSGLNKQLRCCRRWCPDLVGSVSRDAGGKIQVGDSDSVSKPTPNVSCPTDHGTLQFATVTNTDQISVFGDGTFTGRSCPVASARQIFGPLLG